MHAVSSYSLITPFFVTPTNTLHETIQSLLTQSHSTVFGAGQVAVYYSTPLSTTEALSLLKVVVRTKYRK